MKRMRGVLGSCAVAALLTVGAQAAWAAPAVGDDGPAGHAIRVMNNSASAIQVYLKDARGHMHDLGRVATDGRETFTAPTGLAGPFQIEVRPVAPVAAPWTSPDGVGTHVLNVPDGTRVDLWVEMDLKKSRVEIPRG